MAIVAHTFEYVVGVDTHAGKHAFSILHSATGAEIDTGFFPASESGNKRALAWVRRRMNTDHQQVLVSMEGTGSFGALLRSCFEFEGFKVVEAPSPLKRSSRRGKDDLIDAKRAASAVLGIDSESLTDPRRDGIRQALRVLLIAREEMNTHTTAQINRLTALVRLMPLGVDARKPLSHTQIRGISGWRKRDEEEYLQVCRSEAVRLATEIIDRRHQLEANKQQIKALVSSHWTSLLEVKGVGPITAAQFIIVWSHPGRIRSEAAFASLAGVSPIPASSGNNKRMRLNRGGDRNLNHALHTVVLVRLSWDQKTKDYMTKRISEGKSKRETIRILKRYAAREIYRVLNRIEEPDQNANDSARVREPQGLQSLLESTPQAA